jgi:hypothetical protein
MLTHFTTHLNLIQTTLTEEIQTQFNDVNNKTTDIRLLREGGCGWAAFTFLLLWWC